MPVGGLVVPLRGTTLVPGPPGFCKSLGAQMLCCISCHLYSSSQMYFCDFQIEMCLWCLSLFFQTPAVPTLRVTASLVSLPPAHPPRAPELLLTSLLSLLVFFLHPPPIACCTTNIHHMGLEGRALRKEHKTERSWGCGNGPGRRTGLTASGV